MWTFFRALDKSGIFDRDKQPGGVSYWGAFGMGMVFVEADAEDAMHLFQKFYGFLPRTDKTHRKHYEYEVIGGPYESLEEATGPARGVGVVSSTKHDYVMPLDHFLKQSFVNVIRRNRRKEWICLKSPKTLSSRS